MFYKRQRLGDDAASVLFGIAPISVSDLELHSIPSDVYQLMDYINENATAPRNFLLCTELLSYLGVDAYWMLHINGVLGFNEYLCAVEVDAVALFISTSLCMTGLKCHTSAAASPGGNVCSAVAGAIVQYLWEHCDSSRAQEAHNACPEMDLVRRCRVVLDHLSDHYFYAQGAADGARDGLVIGEEQFGLLCRVCAIAAAAVATSTSLDVAEAVLEWEVRQLCLLAGSNSLDCVALHSRGGAAVLVAVLHPRAIITALDKILRRRHDHPLRPGVVAAGVCVDGLRDGSCLFSLVGCAVAMDSGEVSGGLLGEVLSLCHRVFRLGLEDLQASTAGSCCVGSENSLHGLSLRSVSFMVLLQQWAWTHLVPDGAPVDSTANLGGALSPFIYETLLVGINMSYGGGDGAGVSFSSSSSTGAGAGSKRQSCFSLLLSTVLARVIDQLVANPSAAVEETLQQIYRAVRALKRELQESEAIPSTTSAPGSKPKAAVPSASSAADSKGNPSGPFSAAVPLTVLHAFWTLDRKPHRAAINQTLLALKAALDVRFDPQNVNCLSVVPGAATTTDPNATVTDSPKLAAPTASATVVTLPADVTLSMLAHWGKCIESTATLPIGVINLCQKFAPVDGTAAATATAPADRELYAVFCFRRHIAASPAIRPACRVIAEAMLKCVSADSRGGTTVAAAARSLVAFLAESKIEGTRTSVSKPEAPQLSPAGEIERIVDIYWMRLLDKAAGSSTLATMPNVIRSYKELCVICVCLGRRATVASVAVDDSAPVLGYTCAGGCLLTQLCCGISEAVDGAPQSANDHHVVTRLSYCFFQLLMSSKAGDEFAQAMCRILLLLLVQLADHVLVNQDRLLSSSRPMATLQKQCSALSPLHLPHHYRTYWTGVLAKLARIWARGCNNANSPGADVTKFTAANTFTSPLLVFLRTGKLILPLGGLGGASSADVDLFTAVRTSFSLEALLAVMVHVLTADGLQSVIEKLFMQPFEGGNANSMLSNPQAGSRLVIVMRALLQVLIASHSGDGDLTHRLVHWYFVLLHTNLSALHGPISCNSELRALLRSAATQECLSPPAAASHRAGSTADNRELCNRLVVLGAAARKAARIITIMRCYQSSQGELGPAVELTDLWVELCRDTESRRGSSAAPISSDNASAQDVVRLADKLFGVLYNDDSVSGDADRGHVWSGPEEETSMCKAALCASCFMSALRAAGPVGASAACDKQKLLLEHWCGRSVALLAKSPSAPADQVARRAMGQAIYFTCVRVLEICSDSSSRLLAEVCGGWAVVLYQVLCLVHPSSGAIDIDVDIYSSHLGILPPSTALPVTTSIFTPVQTALAWWGQCCCRQGTGLASNMGTKLLLLPQSAVAQPLTGTTPSALMCFQSCCQVARFLASPSEAQNSSCYSLLADIVLADGESACSIDMHLQSAVGSVVVGNRATVACMAIYCSLSGGQDGREQAQRRQWSLTTMAILIRNTFLCQDSAGALASPAVLLCLEMVICCAFWLTFRGRDISSHPGYVNACELLPALHRLLKDLRGREGLTASEAEGHSAWVRSTCHTLLLAAPYPPPSSVCAALLLKIEKDVASNSSVARTSQDSQNAFRNVTNLPAHSVPTNSQKSTNPSAYGRMTYL